MIFVSYFVPTNFRPNTASLGKCPIMLCTELLALNFSFATMTDFTNLTNMGYTMSVLFLRALGPMFLA